MPTNDLRDVLRTVEAMRTQLHPEVDAGFLEAVVRTEQEHPEDDVEALRGIQAALQKILPADGSD